MRLIDADKVEGKLRNIIPKIENLKNVIPEADLFGFGVVQGIKKAINELLDAPTIEAEPVQHGRWIDKGEYAVCTECGGRSGTQYDGVVPIPLMTQFCPNCGAKMRG